MLKFFLGVIIVAFCSFCGRLLAKRYRIRKNFFKQLKEFNERFLNEIAYYRRPLRDFIASFTYQGEFEKLLEDYFYGLEELTPNEKFFNYSEKYDFLTEDEGKGVFDYFTMLGKGDSASQKSYFSSVKERLSSWCQTAESEAKRYGDLYVKLGFLCGLFILILIV